MPSNWLYIDTNFPTFTGEESVTEKVTTIQNYMYMLVEQLRYSLHNLDLSNMNAAAVDSYETSLTGPIYAAIQDEDERITQLAITAAGIAAQVSDAQGNISQLQLTAQALSIAIADAQGNISSIAQTVNSIRLSVSNGGESSYITLTANGAVISGATIYFSGMVTFTDLSSKNGYTTINAGNITTGTITANLIRVSNRFSVYSGNMQYGYMGCGYGSDGVNITFGAMLAGTSDACYLIATNRGVRMTADENSLWCTANGIYASQAITETSDRAVKTAITYEMDRYREFFMRLRPCFFRMVKGTSGRYHTGYIAQDVEAALAETGLDNTDFAGLVKNPDAVSSGAGPEYGLRYSEFAALNTYMIQQLERRVAALEKRSET